jgi:hypothetical protein
MPHSAQSSATFRYATLALYSFRDSGALPRRCYFHFAWSAANDPCTQELKRRLPAGQYLLTREIEKWQVLKQLQRNLHITL